MAVFLNRVGHTYGDLIVIELDPEKNYYPFKYICQCKCGFIFSTWASSLQKGMKRCIKCQYSSRERKHKISDEVLCTLYQQLGSVRSVEFVTGIKKQTAHKYLQKINKTNKVNLFTEDEICHLKKNYTAYLLRGELSLLAKEMGRTKQFICRQAKRVGLTDLNRSKSSLKNFKKTIPKWTKQAELHPRGMLGKKHSNEMKEKMSKTLSDTMKKWKENGKMTQILKKSAETRAKRKVIAPKRYTVKWKGGYRNIGKNGNKYYRSAWEANYARFLQKEMDAGNIKDWFYEEDVFLFIGEETSPFSFNPDFTIILNDGTKECHEVKGWHDERTLNIFDRMRRLYPEIILVVIDAKWFSANKKELRIKIKDWE